MENKDLLLSKYADGSLTQEEESQLEKMIELGFVEIEELDEFTHLNEALDISKGIESGPEMDSKFYAMLQSKIQTSDKSNSWSWLFNSPLKWALGAILLIATFLVGQNFGETSPQIADVDSVKKDFALELMTMENVKDKITLVSDAPIKNETDNKIIDALLFALSNDESINVRLACINTLYEYAYLPEVRTGLINAINSQTSPLVLTNLAEAINASGNRLSSDEFKARIKKEIPEPLRVLVEQSLINI